MYEYICAFIHRQCKVHCIIKLTCLINSLTIVSLPSSAGRLNSRVSRWQRIINYKKGHPQVQHVPCFNVAQCPWLGARNNRGQPVQHSWMQFIVVILKSIQSTGRVMQFCKKTQNENCHEITKITESCD